ncbi:uncharacterized protein LY89DRAFT_740458 [Mollisia scopiformis]|uniref:DUF7730 domain-containing protein n=1 Tax=Mollisia scopiformis TaxID=149040 RepID=A0A132BEF1_MOLSC|nr:uncharacterized protein LY89DRAFT_740458 [Mollisia scopiformis]KUJ10057.1 hypothetical protein LY89DRAFT_740458 [Mollisia scopiformis]
MVSSKQRKNMNVAPLPDATEAATPRVNQHLPSQAGLEASIAYNIETANGMELQVALSAALRKQEQLGLNTVTIDSPQFEVAILRSALAESQQREQALAARLRDLEPFRKKCHLLKTIPIEVRREIYKYLLINPILGSIKSLHNREGSAPGLFGEGAAKSSYRKRYGLHPALLRTCKAVYGEAATILYESNTFFFQSLSNENVLCPLFRNSPEMPLQYSFSRLRLPFPGQRLTAGHFEGVFKKIKHWKVTLSSHKGWEASCPSHGLVYLCRMICDSSPKSLHVEFVPCGSLTIPTFPDIPRQYKASRMLQPLLWLRNLSEFTVTHLPDNETSSYEWWYSPLLVRFRTFHKVDLPKDLVAKLKFIVQSNTPVVRVFKMYQRLLDYTRAFERIEEARRKMDPEYGLLSSPPSYLGSKVAPSVLFTHIDQPGFSLRSVKSQLEYAATASEENNVEVFNRVRHIILEVLEPQYQRIAAAAESMSSFVKSEKRCSGLFGPVSRFAFFFDLSDKCLIPDGLVEIYRYAKTFERDLSLEEQKHKLSDMKRWMAGFAKLPREILLHRLELEMYQRSHELIITSLMKEIIDDMDSQYLQIRKFRMAVFDEDPPGLQYIFDKELWFERHRCDDAINWTVEEPCLTPIEGPKIVQFEGSQGALPNRDDPDDVEGVGYHIDMDNHDEQATGQGDNEM